MEYMSVTQACELWGYSRAHVKRMCAQGKVKAMKLSKEWLIEREQPNPKQEKR